MTASIVQATAGTQSTITPVPLGPFPEQPLVSILVANYNYGRFIGQAIESVLAQTYPHFEVIVCDDGSTDDSVATVGRYVDLDSRIHLVCKRNGGQASAWNRAYPVSSGAVVCILDADDLFAPTKLEELVRTFHENPDVGLVIHPMLVIDADDVVHRQIPPYPQFEHGWIGPKVLDQGGGWNSMFGSALSFRREAAHVIFPVPEEIHDADSFITRIVPLLTPVWSCSEPLTRYRSHGTNDSSHDAGQTTPDQLRMRLDRDRLRETAVNRRLQEAGLGDRVLPVHRNPMLLYWIALLDGSSWRRRVRELIPLLADTVRAPLNSPLYTCGKTAIYCLALVLPMAQRAALMQRFFSIHSHVHASRPWQSWNGRALQSRLKPRASRLHGGDLAHVTAGKGA
jgi:glycosyltransferase involved in cell wall biosynthesis